MTPPEISPRPHMEPYDFKVGQPDNDDNPVIKIYAKFPQYVIYRTSSNIRIDISDTHPDAADCDKNHYKIGFQLARINSLFPENLETTESINRLVGRALALNVAGEHSEASEVLRHAESRLTKLRTIEGRLQYTASAFLPLLCIIVCYLLSTMLVNFCPVFTGFSLEYLEVIGCGALGGFLSIAVGYGSLKIDVDADKKTNQIIGLSRILIAVIASLFVYFAIKSNLLLSFLNERKDNYGILAFCMVAGFIEMLVPKIMNNLGKDAKVSSSGSSERANNED